MTTVKADFVSVAGTENTAANTATENRYVGMPAMELIPPKLFYCRELKPNESVEVDKSIKECEQAKKYFETLAKVIAMENEAEEANNHPLKKIGTQEEGPQKKVNPKGDNKVSDAKELEASVKEVH